MNNRYMKRSHISEAKFREIIRLFSIDLEATKIAQITKISRQTINYILYKIRERIAQIAEKESYFTKGEIEIDESYFGSKWMRGKRDRGAYGKTEVFGMKKRGDKVYTQIIKDCSASELVPIIKRLSRDDSALYTDEWEAYDGLVNIGYKHHYRVKHSNDVFANGRAHVNGIENFWGIAKTLLVKFRGIKSNMFYLHLKETEFRFNHRHEDIFVLLLSEFRKLPL